MGRVSDVRAEIGDMSRIRENLMALHEKIVATEEDYLDFLPPLLDSFAPDGAFDAEAFASDDDAVHDLVAFIAESKIDPQWRVPWTAGQFRRHNGIWVQTFWVMPPSREKIEGKAQSRSRRRALHGAYLHLAAQVTELRILELMVFQARQDEREANREATAAFEERLRLAQEAVEETNRRRAKMVEQDREWERAAPGQTVSAHA